MGNAGRHLPDHCQFTGLNQLILGAAQRGFSLFALVNFGGQAGIAGLQIGGAFGNFSFELIVGLLQGFACS